MWLLTLFACLFVVLYSFVAVNRYFSFKLHKNTYPLTLTILTLNMVMLLFTTYLLPLDIFDATKAASSESPSPSRNGTEQSIEPRPSGLASINSANEVTHNFRVAWLLVYWLEFAICWFIIPVLISYCGLKYAFARNQSGSHHRSPILERLTRAVFQNLKFYLLCLLGLICGLVYLVASTGHGLGDFKPLIISLSHLYSLSYTLILLSTGLIIFPKNLISTGRLPNNDTINRYFVELSKTNDDLNESQMNMLEIAEKILHSSESNNGDVVFDQMLNECKLEVQGILNEVQLSISNHFSGSNSSHINNLHKLNNNYNNFMTNYYSFLHYQTHSNSIIHILAQSQSLNSTPSTSSVWKYTKSILILPLSLISIALSLLVVFLEMTPSKWGHGWIFDGTHWYNFCLQFIIFTYNTLVSLYAMSKFKFSNFHLIPNGRSNPTNALYYSLYSSRLLFPLCFNLMVLIPSKTEHRGKSSFEKTLYDNLTVIPLADYLNRYLPTIIMAIIIVSYKFNIKQKVLLKVLGEEYYYQFFGMMMYEPVGDSDSMQRNDARSDSLLPDADNGFGDRSRMDEDYEYSLQDGRCLFERASSNYNMSTNEEHESQDNNSSLRSYL